MKNTETLFGILTITAALVMHIHAQDFLTNRLVAYYPFNGNANDASGNGNNGTVNGVTLTTDRFGYTNRAYLFGGLSAYITVPFDSTVFSNDFTASVWFNAYDLANAWPTLLYQQSSVQTVSFDLAIAGNACGCADPGSLIAASSYAPASFSYFLVRRQQTPLNTYCQVVLTKSGTNVTMYLNSEVAVTGQVSNPVKVSTSTLWIGRAEQEDVPGGHVFHGVIDDIRIYSRALSALEVQKLYEYESGPRIALLKAVKPSFSNLWIGTNYQLQVSTDLNTWYDQGPPFTATSTNMVYPAYYDVDFWNGLFFRLQVAP